MNFTSDQQAVLQEIVEYWSNRGEKEKMESFSENDVLSLFNVISGHFLVQKGDFAKVEPVAKQDIYQCNECGKWFDLPHSLERHKQSHQNKDKFACTKCDKTFLYQLTLSKHMAKHHVESVPGKCDKCDKSFSSQEYLEEHRQIHHPATEVIEC